MEDAADSVNVQQAIAEALLRAELAAQLAVCEVL
jgi:hypothetical protein